MGVVLNWTSAYPTTIDDRITNFPTVTDNVHDVLASHVNELADAVVALQAVAGGLRTTNIADPLSPSNGDVLTYNSGSGEWEASAASVGSLQAAYVGGNTIDVTSGEGSITITNSADITHMMTLSRTFAGAGDAINITMGASTTGDAINITVPAGGDALVAADGTDTFLIEAGRLFITNATAFTQLTNAQLQVSDGTNTAILAPTSLTLPQSIETIPTINFTGAATDGIGFDGTDINFITNGVARMSVRDALILFNLDARGVAGTIAEPSWICGSAGPGIFSDSGRLGISVEATTQVGFIGGLLDNATGDEIAVSFEPTVNKATSGNYTALRIDVTETAAPGTDDRLLDLQVGSTSQMYVTNAGKIAVSIGSTSDPGMSFVGDEDTGFTAANANQLSVVLAAIEEFRFSVGSATSRLWFQNAGDAIQPNLTGWNDDTGVYFPGSSTVGISTNGTEGALFSLDGAAFTGTLDAATGDEVSYAFDTTVNKATSGNYTGIKLNVTETAAPGTDDRLLDLQVGSVTQMHVTNGGHTIVADGDASNPGLALQTDKGLYSAGTDQLGVSVEGAAALVITRLADEATGDEVLFDFTGVVNKATSGNYTGLRLNVTETAAPGTDDRLLDLQVGGTTEAYITNGGHVLADSGAIGAPGFGFVAAANTGMFLNASDVVFTRSGAQRFRISGAYISATVGSGSAGAPTIRPNNALTTTGLFTATDQLGLAANGEAIIVDNDSTVPSLRPDVDDTWSLGESSLRYTTVYSVDLDTGDINLRSLNDDAHWTVVEDRRGLFLRDRLTGKAYKLLMEEIDPGSAPRTADELKEE